MSLECLAVSFKSNHFKIIIIAIYIPPNSSVNVYKYHYAEIENLRVIFSDYTFIIVGHFNLPGIKWSNQNHALLFGQSSDKSKVLAETLAYEQFFQYNFIPNYGNNILDLVISDNHTLEVSKGSYPLVSIDVAHTPLQIDGPIFVSSLKSSFPSLEFNFRHANYESINSYLNNIDWDSVLNESLDYSVTITNFYSVIHNAINLFISKVYKYKNQYPQWYSRELKSLIYNKKQLHKEFKFQKIPISIVSFREYEVYANKNPNYVIYIIYKKSNQT
jgi:hypothetical protein